MSFNSLEEMSSGLDVALEHIGSLIARVEALERTAAFGVSRPHTPGEHFDTFNATSDEARPTTDEHLSASVKERELKSSGESMFVVLTTTITSRHVQTIRAIKARVELKDLFSCTRAVANFEYSKRTAPGESFPGPVFVLAVNEAVGLWAGHAELDSLQFDVQPYGIVFAEA